MLDCPATATIVERADVVYPPIAAQQGIDGVVTVIIAVGVDGRPTAVRAAAGTHRFLRDAAEDAARASRYAPSPATCSAEQALRVAFVLQRDVPRDSGPAFGSTAPVWSAALDAEQFHVVVRSSGNYRVVRDGRCNDAGTLPPETFARIVAAVSAAHPEQWTPEGHGRVLVAARQRLDRPDRLVAIEPDEYVAIPDGGTATVTLTGRAMGRATVVGVGFGPAVGDARAIAAAMTTITCSPRPPAC